MSDSESDSNTGDLTDDNDEDTGRPDHKISNTDTIIHMLKVRSEKESCSLCLHCDDIMSYFIAGQYWDWHSGHAGRY